jgi:raffinose/stachyose/melibiose transport system permease protein
LDFFGKDFIYYAIVVCLSVPAVVVLVPLFYTLKQAGLLNSYLGVALTEAALTLPFGILMLRNYSDNIPREFSEAATMDGAGNWELFIYVYLPLARPALINLATLAALWSFQDFLLPAVFNTNAHLTTAAVATQLFRGYQGFTALNLGRYNASLVLLALPALVLLIFGQRFIVSGLTSGGIKS